MGSTDDPFRLTTYKGGDHRFGDDNVLVSSGAVLAERRDQGNRAQNRPVPMQSALAVPARRPRSAPPVARASRLECRHRTRRQAGEPTLEFEQSEHQRWLPWSAHSVDSEPRSTTRGSFWPGLPVEAGAPEVSPGLRAPGRHEQAVPGT
jgi:hypothetical protein